MKILLVNKYFNMHGGSETYFFGLADLLRQAGHEVIFFAMQDEKNLPCEQSAYFVSNVEFNGELTATQKLKAAFRMVYSFEAKKKISALIEKEKPDIIHINLFHRVLTASIVDAAKKHGIPVVFTMHDLNCVCPNHVMLDHGKICEACLHGNYWNCVKRVCFKDSRAKCLMAAIESDFNKRSGLYRKIDLFITPSECYKNKLEASGLTKSPIVHMKNFLPADTRYAVQGKRGDFLLERRIFLMNTPAKASLPVIKRLPKYYRYLRSLQADGITSISSRELAAQMGTTASQVRQDFNCIGDVNGRQGIGYSVENLLSILESLLFGNGDRLPTILIGCGRLGKAVSRFITTDTNGYRLIAAFDVAQSEVGKEISGIQIRHIDELESFCAEHHPKVAVLCVPRDGAEQVSGRLVDLGIEGFWNFSHYDLSVPYPDVVVENVHLGDSLMSLGYRLRNQD